MGKVFTTNGIGLAKKLLGMSGGSAPPPPGFLVSGVVCTRSNMTSDRTYLEADGSTFGAVDGPNLITSFWLRAPSVGAADSASFGKAYGGDLGTASATSGVYVANLDETDYLEGTSSVGAVPVDEWCWVGIRVKTDESAGNKIVQMYINDTDVTDVIDDGGTGSFLINLEETTWQVGRIGTAGGAVDRVIEVAEFYTAAAALDLSIEANRRKFYSAAGKPVDLGVDGSAPTGSQPLIYLHVAQGGVAADFATNLGSGGNFTIITTNGPLTLASSSPSD